MTNIIRKRYFSKILRIRINKNNYKVSLFVTAFLFIIYVRSRIDITTQAINKERLQKVKRPKQIGPETFGPEAYGNYTIQMAPNLEKLINWTNPRYPYNVTYLIENPDLCTSVKDDLSVLVVVNSGTEHFDRRLAIRKTWTNNKYYSHLGTVRVLFLLGMTANPLVQEGIEEEAEAFRDILQGDFIDTYLNLTHKGVMGFKWITERCRNAKMIMKVDDDFVINMFLYFQKVDTVLQSINVFCELIEGRVQRNKTSKWFVSEDHFRGEARYERYCEGKFVSMTNDIIPSLYESAMRTPFFPYDDVLLFGYVMHNIPGLKYRSETECMAPKNDEAMKCLREQNSKCDNLVIATNDVFEMETAWAAILENFGT
ncbi:beta-1,3-galactosyltransferase 1-like [Ruditapes philippinarum]|uniref:beta-1,3-galactosyltransferase 1-like n=1 Tax=Ruditapes philippinarum TaxID=129788 RepID=UPI00295C2ED5|nr:beta-1,3-galactosyltransferase 1-like [Ruditapes philippinarum]